MCRSEPADAGGLLQAFGIELQPVGHGGYQASFDQPTPCAGPGAWQGQALFTAKPGEAGNELLITALAGLPAAVSMMAVGRRRDDRLAFDRAMHNLLQAWNGQPGQADGHLVAGADVEGVPARQRTQAYLGNPSVV
ncbi:hypothetical protein D3C78_1493440 [compost metagenome]